METSTKVPVVIYAESTPNPSSMKFVADKLLINGGITAEYLNPAEAKGSPLAVKLFQFPFVKSVFISGNYITISKTEAVSWEDITLELRDFIRNFITEGNIIINELPPKKEVYTDSSFKRTESAYTDHAVPHTETETKIVETLEQYIRPAVEQDGGLISFKSFKEGIVTVILKGSCSGCPSSTVTLKAGIEALLKRMVPGVKEVVAEGI